MQKNEQLELAEKFVELTNKNLFLTGKAGTGKTTFLHNLKKTTPKRVAIVAPTGVAAINAGGVTIHSFFQLPFGPYIPGKGTTSDSKLNQKISREKIDTIRSIDLLVIDEISMVRADLLDSIDEVLRRYKNPAKPFGGTQLLMIGDLHQLSPVIKNEEWMLLKDYYPNLYFFNSLALKLTSPVTLELKHIYRQTDSEFIDLLNCIRENRINSQVLAKLNERYISNFTPKKGESYITLTTHNRSADEINGLRLKEIKEPSRKFQAVIRDSFPEASYPNAVELEFKVGAQVMFVKNDSSKEKVFYNGKIGTVTRMTDELIFVKGVDDLMEIPVYATEWQNIKFVLNPQTKEIEEHIIGSFIQHPLKLAWAITVHKSQGLTFERAIIDAGSSFAHGQVYVALSRCKSFEGIVLKTPLTTKSIRTDSTVAEYSKKADENTPGEEYLQKSKEDFQQSLLFDLFDFTILKRHVSENIRLAQEHDSILNKSFLEDLEQIKTGAEEHIYKVAESFKNNIKTLLVENRLVEENTPLQERIKTACKYFQDKLKGNIEQPLETIIFETDNKVVNKKIDQAIDGLRKEVFIKMQLTKLCLAGFNTLSYLKTVADSETDYKNKLLYITNLAPTNQSIEHFNLSEALKNWRNKTAKDKGVPIYNILTLGSISEIVTKLPLTIPMLEKIKGIGKTKIKQFGHEILEIISTFANLSDSETFTKTENAPVKRKVLKGDSQKTTLNLYKQGKKVAEIARERDMSITTVEGHLIDFISVGKVSVSDFVSEEKLKIISNYFKDKVPKSLYDAKVDLGNEIFYSEIKAVSEWMKLPENLSGSTE